MGKCDVIHKTGSTQRNATPPDEDIAKLRPLVHMHGKFNEVRLIPLNFLPHRNPAIILLLCIKSIPYGCLHYSRQNGNVAAFSRERKCPNRRYRAISLSGNCNWYATTPLRLLTWTLTATITRTTNPNFHYFCINSMPFANGNKHCANEVKF